MTHEVMNSIARTYGERRSIRVSPGFNPPWPTDCEGADPAWYSRRHRPQTGRAEGPTLTYVPTAAKYRRHCPAYSQRVRLRPAIPDPDACEPHERNRRCGLCTDRGNQGWRAGAYRAA